jgi:aerobic-type carbon monoxide dehydrogenase small subunit (CoxS/CutS family)
MEETIRFTLNGKRIELLTEPNQTLIWVLRNQLGLTGTKFGCGTGFCGACTVLINDEPVRSCMIPVSDIAGKKVITIEGLESKGKLHPVQKAFVEHDALQCGFCTPGMILTTVGLLKKNPSPTREEVVAGLEENLCRCTAHVRIVEAVLDAAKEMRGGK